MTSLARTMASLTRTVSKPFPTNSLPLPPGFSSASTQRGRQPETDAVGWWVGGTEDVLEPSIFLDTFLVYRYGIYLLLYVIETCHQHSCGFQNLMSIGGVGILF